MVAPISSALADGTRVLITPEFAERILAETHYSGQRPIEDNHVLLLAMEMEQETFLPNQQIDFGELDGALYLLNGRHRVTGVVVSGVPTLFSVAVHKVRSQEELGALYCRFDTMIRKRTASQIISATALADADPNGLSKAVAKVLFAATPLLMGGFTEFVKAQNIETKNIDRRIAAAKEWKPAAVLYQSCLDASEVPLPRRFKSVGVASVALATLRYQPDLAKVFWSYAVANNGLTVGDPRRTLHMDLVSRDSISGGNGYDLARVASVAWNAYFEKRLLKIIKVYKAPIRIAGTPFDGRAA